MDKLKILNYLDSLNILYDINQIFIKINLSTIEYNIIRYQSGLAGLLFIN